MVLSVVVAVFSHPELFCGRWQPGQLMWSGGAVGW